MKKFLCMILSVAMFFSVFAACSKTGKKPNGTQNGDTVQVGDTDETGKGNDNSAKVFSLPYRQKDKLNPYTAESQLNLNLLTLLYDSLYRLDEAFTAQPLLAQAGVTQGKEMTVTLKDGLCFSDRTPLTATDVCASFEAAKRSANFASKLENIISIKKINNYVVSFRLASPDVYALNCLTFPIIKRGEEENDIPTGSGRYFYSSGKLKINENNAYTENANFDTLYLFDIKSSEYETGALQIGNISFLFRDFSDGETERIIASSKRVTMNNLVFISFNGKNPLLKNKDLRRMLSLAIKRESVSQGAFRGYAKPSRLPFNPDWSETADIQTESYTPVQITEMLESYGYKYKSATDAYRSDKKGRELSFKLVANKDNTFKREAALDIKSDLSAVGIKVDVKLLSREDYLKAVKEESFDMYLGEVQLCDNMDLGVFFSKKGNAAYGINKKLECISCYKNLLSGRAAMADFIASFEDETPFAPICFRMGSAEFSNELEENAEPCIGDLFANIQQWAFK